MNRSTYNLHILANLVHWTDCQGGRLEYNSIWSNHLWICCDVFQHCICRGLFHHVLEDSLDSRKVEDYFLPGEQVDWRNETLNRLSSGSHQIQFFPTFTAIRKRRQCPSLVGLTGDCCVFEESCSIFKAFAKGWTLITKTNPNILHLRYLRIVTCNFSHNKVHLP